MRKTDKKLDNQLIKLLTEVCETALEDFSGFQWLTHIVDYSNFPKSLKVICVFDTNEHLNGFFTTNGYEIFTRLIQKQLFKLNINVDSKHISYDTEESCHQTNNGNWAERLKSSSQLRYSSSTNWQAYSVV